MSAAVSGGVNKKRKKSETKPHAQAQINKCRNEKRRREQENIYIEELAELISASLADMSSLSVKPDKCAILKETVHRIQHIKQQEGSSSDAAVQQGEVSSSKPTILANEVFGPLLLEALEGFLFVVNTEGKVEYVTENVCQFIKYTKEDVLGQSIYNIIHLGDHARFSASLLPMSIGWTSEPSPNRNRSFNCRFLIKPPDNQDETMEEKQQRVSKYETMQISSTLLPYPGEKTEGGDVTSESAEVGPCLMCVARRIPQNEKPQGVPFEQFTTKLDVSGKIIGIDTSGVSSTYSQYLNKDLMGCIIQELCHQHDLQKLANHLKEALHTGNSTSAPYRLRVTNPDKYIHVQTKSKLFKSNGTLAQEPDFIMATHSIIGDNEIAPAECGHLSNSQTHSPRGGNQVAAAGQSSSNGNSNAVGGPLMGGSSVNGQTSGASTTATTPRSSSGGNVSSSGFGTLSSDNTITLQTPSSYATYTLSSNELNLNDFDFFPTSTWDLGPGENSSTGAPQTPSAGWGERPDSRQSLTPVSTPTPRPPSIPGYSPNSPSPLNNPYSQPSPAGTNNNRATTPANPFANSFPFSPLQDQAPGFGGLEDQAKDQSKEEENTSSQQPTGELGRLRNLLTNKRPSTGGTDEGSEGDESRSNEHRILKGLLNQEDKDEVGRGEEGSGRGMVSRPASEPPKVSSSNNMLLRLLNEKSDDDDLEQQKQNELLQQLLLKKQDEERKDGSASAMSSAAQAQQQQEDPLLKSLGFPNPTPSPPSNTDVLSIIGTRKRPSEEGDEPSSKRPMDIHPKVSSSGPTVPTSGNSKLWEKNKMLASLLAKQPSQPTTIPPIPASIITATPQEKLPRVMDPSKQRPGGWSGGSLQPPSSTTSVVSTRPTLQQQQVRHMQQQQQHQQQQQQQQQQQRSSGGFISLSHSEQQHHAQKLQHTAFAPSNPPVSTATAAVSGDSTSIWDSQSSDPVLSDLLDQVIDFVPDNIIPDAAMLLLDAMESPTSSNYQQQDMNEKMMINAIQMKLMQCESAVKSPSSPTISLPGTPPAYTSTTTLSQPGGFPPPPTYQQRPRFTLQQATNQLGMRTVAAAGTQYTMGTATLTTNQQMLLQQRKILHHNTIQQQKQRLLQQQQQQQVLMTSNAPAADQLPSGLQNIESLLNNTVAPNVSLQRSSSVPDSQLSPSYAGQMGAAQISPGQRQPYSPHSQLTSPLGQAAASQGQPQPGTQPQQQGFSPVGAGLNSFPSSQQAAQARLSPHPPGGLPSFQQSQLSPRISQAQPYQQGGVSLSQSSAQQQVAVSSWSQAAASRLSLQQQQNPMLNAQLTGAGGYTGGSGGANVRQFATQRSQSGAPVRSLPSPGAPGGPRQSPYPPEFPPPASPTAGANYQSTGQFQQQLRLQRTISAPSATTQLPGGVSSPRGHYGLKQEPLLSPIPPHHPMPYPDHLHHPHHPHPHHPHPHHMLYHQPSPPIADSQFCFDQTGIQIYGASERGRSNHQPGGGNNGISSEYVRQELRAVVGARTQQQAGNGATRQQQQQLQLTQQVSPADLDALGLSFEMPSSGASDSQKLWGNIGSDLGSGSPQPGLSSSSRNTMEESPRPGDQKSSLLQKLLSE